MMEVQINQRTPQAIDFGTKAEGAMMSTRVAWLRQGHEESAKSKSLQQKLTERGLQLAFVNINEEDFTQIRNIDLILVEAFGHFREDLTSLMTQVRTHSHAPVIIVTDNQTLDWASTAITAGADAIVPSATPDEVILARCNALLRRWRPAR
jgi:DNA-binding response OmpR family regulator